MKKLTFILALCLMAISSQATIFRLGYPGVGIAGKDFLPQNFTDLHNAASSGDTVQIYQQYFNTQQQLIISKNLRLVGYGYNLNTNSGFQVMSLPDTVQIRLDIAFVPGSAGSSVEGLFMQGISFQDSNLTVKRCKLYNNPNDCFSIDAGNVNIDNLLIQDCHFKGKHDTISNNWSVCQEQFGSNNWGPATSMKNFRFLNNIYEGTFVIPIIANNNVLNPPTGLIANNVFIHKKGFVETAPLFQINGAAFIFIKNNIFYNDSIKTIEAYYGSYNSGKIQIPITCIFQNNVSNIPAAYNLWGATNQWGMSNLFVAGFSNGFFTSETGVQLAAGSPALTAGKNNAGAATQCGVFGGEAGQVYKLSGIPAIPAVYQLSAPSINANTNPYNITTSTRSNN
jgi:hypothetical protein